MIFVRGDRRVTIVVKLLSIEVGAVVVRSTIRADDVVKNVNEFRMIVDDSLNLSYVMNIDGVWTAHDPQIDAEAYAEIIANRMRKGA